MSERNLGLIGYEHASHKEAWQLVFDNADQLAFVVINVHSGVGDGIDGEYVGLVAELKAYGVPVLGYVATGTQDPNHPADPTKRLFGTRSLVAIQREMEDWKVRYEVDGFFYDEVAQGKLTYYTRIRGMSPPETLVILNPGALPDRTYFGILNTIIATAETSQENYLARSFPEWEKDARAFHIIYGVTNPEAVMARIKSNRAEYFYLTSIPGPDPQYDVASTIFPPKPTVTPPTSSSPNSTENFASLTLREIAHIIGMGPDSTLKDVPAKVRALSDRNYLLENQIDAGIAASTDEEILADVARRLKRL